MRKLFISLMLISMLVMSSIAAFADSHLFPAQNESACEAAGGEFSRDSNLRTCVVVGEPVTTTETLREAGRSGRSWDSRVTRQTTTTYTRDGDDRDTVSTSTVVISCTNPGGNEVAAGEGQCPSS